MNKEGYSVNDGLAKNEGIDRKNLVDNECLPEAPLGDYFDFSIAKKVRVIINWEENIPRTKQLILLKKVCPIIKEMTIADLAKQARHDIYWEIGTMWIGEAEDFCEEAKKIRINNRVEEFIRNEDF